MALIRQRSFTTRKQAVEFLIRDQHLLVQAEVAEWFGYARIHFSETELKEKSRDLIGKQVRKSYCRSADWSGTWEYIVMPYYKFVTSSRPYYYDFNLHLYLVASLEVDWVQYGQEYRQNCVVIELIKKDLEKFQLPLDFLEAIGRGDLSHFQQRERDNRGYYTWHSSSLARDIKLHGVLLRCLGDAFQGKPLGPALVYYGLANWAEGKLAERSLLMLPPAAVALVNGEAPACKRAEVEEALTSKTLGIGAKEAGKALDAAFNPSLSLEDNITNCLKYLGGHR